MTLFDLKEQALAGKKLRRKCWLAGNYICFENYKNYPSEYKLLCQGMCDVSLETALANDWEVMPELVDWFTAWKALEEGKHVKVPDGSIWRKGIGPFPTLVREKGDNDYPYNQKYGGACLTAAPLEWLSRNDFEVLDETP